MTMAKTCARALGCLAITLLTTSFAHTCEIAAPSRQLLSIANKDAANITAPDTPVTDAKPDNEKTETAVENTKVPDQQIKPEVAGKKEKKSWFSKIKGFVTRGNKAKAPVTQYKQKKPSLWKRFVNFVTRPKTIQQNGLLFAPLIAPSSPSNVEAANIRAFGTPLSVAHKLFTKNRIPLPINSVFKSSDFVFPKGTNPTVSRVSIKVTKRDLASVAANNSPPEPEEEKLDSVENVEEDEPENDAAVEIHEPIIKQDKEIENINKIPDFENLTGLGKERANLVKGDLAPSPDYELPMDETSINKIESELLLINNTIKISQLSKSAKETAFKSLGQLKKVYTGYFMAIRKYRNAAGTTKTMKMKARNEIEFSEKIALSKYDTYNNDLTAARVAYSNALKTGGQFATDKMLTKLQKGINDVTFKFSKFNEKFAVTRKKLISNLNSKINYKATAGATSLKIMTNHSDAVFKTQNHLFEEIANLSQKEKLEPVVTLNMTPHLKMSGHNKENGSPSPIFRSMNHEVPVGLKTSFLELYVTSEETPLAAREVEENNSHLGLTEDGDDFQDETVASDTKNKLEETAEHDNPDSREAGKLAGTGDASLHVVRQPPWAGHKVPIRGLEGPVDINQNAISGYQHPKVKGNIVFGDIRTLTTARASTIFVDENKKDRRLLYRILLAGLFFFSWFVVVSATGFYAGVML